MSKHTSIIKKHPRSSKKAREIFFHRIEMKERSTTHTFLDDERPRFGSEVDSVGTNSFKLLPGCPDYYYFIGKERKVRSERVRQGGWVAMAMVDLESWIQTP